MTALSNTNTERTDILGADWTARTIELRPDEEGPVVAPLVYRSERRAQSRAVLYVHGSVNYFFQTHMAEEWIAHGYDFYALDLRKYGRSLLTHQTPNFITDLGGYQEELDAAARLLRDKFGHHILVVMWHSTGGLLTSLWTHARRGLGIVDALVLNSPWFDLNGNWLEDTVHGPSLSSVTRVTSIGYSQSRRRRVSGGRSTKVSLAAATPNGAAPGRRVIDA